jgi:hypothetical protein
MRCERCSLSSLNVGTKSMRLQTTRYMFVSFCGPWLIVRLGTRTRSVRPMTRACGGRTTSPTTRIRAAIETRQQSCGESNSPRQIIDTSDPQHRVHNSGCNARRAFSAAAEKTDVATQLRVHHTDPLRGRPDDVYFEILPTFLRPPARRRRIGMWEWRRHASMASHDHSESRIPGDEVRLEFIARSLMVSTKTTGR